MSERRAGQLLSLSNPSLRYRSRRPADDYLRRRLRELAAERLRYGYQRLWVLLWHEGWQVNHKRVYRLYREERLKLRKRRRRSRTQVERVLLSPPMQNGYIKSFDGKFRDGCLSQHWFVSLEETRRVSEEWRVDYNERRPHRSLQHQTPAQFAAKRGSKQPAELSL